LKKTTDTFLRLLIVILIFGAIGYYYYQKFNHPTGPILRSPVVKLPVYVEKKEVIEVKSTEKNKQESGSKVEIQTDNKTSESEQLKKTQQNNENKDNKTVIKENKEKIVQSKEIKPTNSKSSKAQNNKSELKQHFYKIVIKQIINPREVALIKNYAIAHLPGVKISITKYKKNVVFKRVLIGPFKTKSQMIRYEEKVKKLKLEHMKFKLRNYYYVHVGSYSSDYRLKEILQFLKRHGIKNLVLMSINVLKDAYNIEVSNIPENKIKLFKEFLDDHKMKYQVK